MGPAWIPRNFAPGNYAAQPSPCVMCVCSLTSSISGQVGATMAHTHRAHHHPPHSLTASHPSLSSFSPPNRTPKKMKRKKDKTINNSKNGTHVCNEQTCTCLLFVQHMWPKNQFVHSTKKEKKNCYPVQKSLACFAFLIRKGKVLPPHTSPNFAHSIPSIP